MTIHYQPTPEIQQRIDNTASAFPIPCPCFPNRVLSLRPTPRRLEEARRNLVKYHPYRSDKKGPLPAHHPCPHPKLNFFISFLTVHFPHYTNVLDTLAKNRLLSAFPGSFLWINPDPLAPISLVEEDPLKVSSAILVLAQRPTEKQIRTWKKKCRIAEIEAGEIFLA